MKRVIYVLYSWGSTILFVGLLFWLATVPNLSAGDSETTEAIKVLYRLVLYLILFLFIYRSIIATLRTTVDRLSKWRSKREEQEDAEFVLIIETMAVLLSIFIATLISFTEEILQYELNVEGRIVQYQDILVSLMAILLGAIAVYSMPMIGELEVAIKHRIDEVRKKK